MKQIYLLCILFYLASLSLIGMDVTPKSLYLQTTDGRIHTTTDLIAYKCKTLKGFLQEHQTNITYNNPYPLPEDCLSEGFSILMLLLSKNTQESKEFLAQQKTTSLLQTVIVGNYLDAEQTYMDTILKAACSRIIDPRSLAETILLPELTQTIKIDMLHKLLIKGCFMVRPDLFSKSGLRKFCYDFRDKKQYIIFDQEKWDSTKIDTATQSENPDWVYAVKKLQFSPNGKMLAVVIPNFVVLYNVANWSVRTKLSTKSPTQPSKKSWNSNLTWSPDSKTLVVDFMDNTLSLYDTINDNLTKTSQLVTGEQGQINKLQWRPGTDQFAVALRNNTVQIIDKSGMTSKTLNQNNIESIAWNHDGTKLAIGTTRGESPTDDSPCVTKIFDASADQYHCIKTINTPDKNAEKVEDLTWNQQGLLACLWTGNIPNITTFLNTETSEELPLETNYMSFDSLTWNPSGDLIAHSSNYGLDIYNPKNETYILITPCKRCNWNQMPISWSPDGSQIAYSRGNKKVKIVKFDTNVNNKLSSFTLMKIFLNLYVNNLKKKRYPDLHMPTSLFEEYKKLNLSEQQDIKKDIKYTLLISGLRIFCQKQMKEAWSEIKNIAYHL